MEELFKLGIPRLPWYTISSGLTLDAMLSYSHMNFTQRLTSAVSSQVSHRAAAIPR